MILLRILVCVMLFCLPFVLFVAASRKPENGMWLIFPVFGAVPAIIGALLVFAPIEAALDARGLGHWKNAAIPLAGASLIFIFVLVMQGLSGKLGLMFARIAEHPGQTLVPLLVWSVLGAFWGLLWRATAWLGLAIRSWLPA
jgi:hypothetical protein